jgi:hypothetical protein
MFIKLGSLEYQFGLDAKTLVQIKYRGLKFLTRGFLVQNWVNENGKSPLSFINFLKELKKIDKSLPMIVLFDANTLIKFMFNNSRIYSLLRKIRYCGQGDRKTV